MKKWKSVLFGFLIASCVGAFAADDILREIRLSDGKTISIRAEDLREPPSRLIRGNVILVDTHDPVACRKVQDSLEGIRPSDRGRESVDDLCDRRPGLPRYASVTVFSNEDTTEFRRQIDISPLTSTDRTIVNETRNMALTMGAAMGVLWLMPGTITNWDKEKIRKVKDNMFYEYKENIRNGPVMDGDDWYFNWVGHPISGAAYYVMARHTGLSKMESFGYSVLMSTFFWEYGFEALAEVPSIQDLIITPVVGSILGEAFMQMEAAVLANGGELMGSRTAGRVALVVLNPMGTISSGINSVLGSRVVQKAEASLVTRGVPKDRNRPELGDHGAYIGVEVRFVF